MTREDEIDIASNAALIFMQAGMPAAITESITAMAEELEEVGDTLPKSTVATLRAVTAVLLMVSGGARHV